MSRILLCRCRHDVLAQVVKSAKMTTKQSNARCRSSSVVQALPSRNHVQRQCSPQTILKPKPEVRPRLECQSTQSRYRTRRMSAVEAMNSTGRYDSAKKQLLPFLDYDKADNLRASSNETNRSNKRKIPDDACAEIVSVSSGDANSETILQTDESNNNNVRSVDAIIPTKTEKCDEASDLVKFDTECPTEARKFEMGSISNKSESNKISILQTPEKVKLSLIPEDVQLDKDLQNQRSCLHENQMDGSSCQFAGMDLVPSGVDAEETDLDTSLSHKTKRRKILQENTVEQSPRKEIQAFSSTTLISGNEISSGIEFTQVSQESEKLDLAEHCNESISLKTDCHQITPDLINIKAMKLFPKEHVVDTACISARLFACYILLEEQNVSELFPFLTKEEYTESDLPLLPLMQALVTVEAVSLQPSESGDKSSVPKLKSLLHLKKSPSSESNNSDSRPRRIHFSGIDCSSTIPPVDRVSGSLSHQRSSINALIAAKMRIEDLEYNVQGISNATTYLRRLIQFFQQSLSDEQNELKLFCAKAVCSEFSPNRIEYARTLYLHEFQSLLNRLLKQASENENEPQPAALNEQTYSTDHSQDFALTMEKRLADLVGQSIRYCLRMILNPQPPRLSPKDKTYKQQTKSFSKVSSLVELRMPNDDSNEALDDACISALVSIALQALYEFCGPESLLMMATSVQNKGKETNLFLMIDPKIPTSFCASPSSGRELSLKFPYVFIDEDDLLEIQDDIRDATLFLAAAKACRFLLDLFSTEAVIREIERLGGWSHAEFYAKISRQFRLWKICDYDAHLVPLSDHAPFLLRLQDLCSLFETQVPVCEEALLKLSERMHRFSKNRNVQMNSPNIKVVIDALEESKERIEAFPVVIKS